MSQNLTDLHSKLIGYLKEGKFVEGIEDFYAADATAQENTNAPTVGQDTMVKHEREFLTKVTAYHGIEVLATAIDDQGGGSGIVMYEAIMQWDQSDKGHVTVNQMVVERWKGGEIVHIRFYGNFDPGS